MWPGGLYGPGMHDFVMRESELGRRVAAAQDDEDCGFGALFDRLVQEGMSTDVAANPTSDLASETMQIEGQS